MSGEAETDLEAPVATARAARCALRSLRSLQCFRRRASPSRLPLPVPPRTAASDRPSLDRRGRRNRSAAPPVSLARSLAGRWPARGARHRNHTAEHGSFIG